MKSFQDYILINILTKALSKEVTSDNNLHFKGYENTLMAIFPVENVSLG